MNDFLVLQYSQLKVVMKTTLSTLVQIFTYNFGTVLNFTVKIEDSGAQATKVK